LCAGRKNGSRPQLQNAVTVTPDRRDPKCAQAFNEVHNAVICVEIKNIDRKQHEDGVDTLRWNGPHSFIRLQSQFAQQSFQTREVSIRPSYAQTQERFAGLIKDAEVITHFLIFQRQLFLHLSQASERRQSSPAAVVDIKGELLLFTPPVFLQNSDAHPSGVPMLNVPLVHVLAAALNQEKQNGQKTHGRGNSNHTCHVHIENSSSLFI
jgi:hypothetical protein